MGIFEHFLTDFGLLTKFKRGSIFFPIIFDPSQNIICIWKFSTQKYQPIPPPRGSTQTPSPTLPLCICAFKAQGFTTPPLRVSMHYVHMCVCMCRPGCAFHTCPKTQPHGFRAWISFWVSAHLLKHWEVAINPKMSEGKKRWSYHTTVEAPGGRRPGHRITTPEWRKSGGETAPDPSGTVSDRFLTVRDPSLEIPPVGQAKLCDRTRSRKKMKFKLCKSAPFGLLFFRSFENFIWTFFSVENIMFRVKKKRRLMTTVFMK